MNVVLDRLGDNLEERYASWGIETIRHVAGGRENGWGGRDGRESNDEGVPIVAPAARKTPLYNHPVDHSKANCDVDEIYWDRPPNGLATNPSDDLRDKYSTRLNC